MEWVDNKFGGGFYLVNDKGLAVAFIGTSLVASIWIDALFETDCAYPTIHIQYGSMEEARCDIEAALE